jgi:2'-5' RNA ligase
LPNKRLQLTLFVAPTDAVLIEQIRREFNPVQYQLISSHVTLCREDELTHLKILKQNLAQLKAREITIDFGEVIRFSEGKGVLMPAIGTNESFQQLRVEILKGMIAYPRLQEPHITLIHPRNATCTDAVFEEIKKYPLPRQLTFQKISFIEQEIGAQWHVLEEWSLI